MHIAYLTWETQSLLIIFPQLEKLQKTPQPQDIYEKKVFQTKILTLMDLEEEMMK